ncbi:MAG: hypothetical protein ACQESK_03620 [Bacteroidota bacterium]
MKSILYIFAIVAALLMIPFIAMQFSDEVNWSVYDFIAAGVLLGGSGLVVDLIFTEVKNRKHKIWLLSAILLLLCLLWIELAVGVFGTPVAGN